MNENTAAKHGMNEKESFCYTKVCTHCGCNLHTKKEYEQERCKRCHEEYEEEMYAMYGNEW